MKKKVTMLFNGILISKSKIKFQLNAIETEISC